MELFYFKEAARLDDFIKKASSRPANQSGAEFLQSWEWGEILRVGGEEIIRLGVVESPSAESAAVVASAESAAVVASDESALGGSKKSHRILAAVTLVKKPLGAGYFYWFAPRGPIFSPELLATESIKTVEDFLWAEIKKLNRRAIFLRFEPMGVVVVPLIKKTLDLEPAQTLILDLAAKEGKGRDPEELLAAMSQKTRYNIRLAEKKGVEIRRGTAADFSEFWRLMKLTGARDNFRPHGAEHYKNLIERSAGSPDFIKLYLARYEGKNIAAGLFCFWGDKVTYLHGASDNRFRNVMAPVLLQWAVIKEARAAAYAYYDFYGIDEKKWPGVTRFKLGFGGRKVEYPGTYDLVFKPGLYGVYNFLRRLRRCRPGRSRSDAGRDAQNVREAAATGMSGGSQGSRDARSK